MSDSRLFLKVIVYVNKGSISTKSRIIMGKKNFTTTMRVRYSKSA